MNLRVVIFSISCLVLSGCGSSHEYYKEANAIGAEIQKILVQQKICANDQDCIRRETLFYKGDSDGIFVAVYGVSDDELVKRLLNAAVDAHGRIPAGIACQVKLFSISFRERSMFGPSPRAVLEIRKKK